MRFAFSSYADPIERHIVETSNDIANPASNQTSTWQVTATEEKVIMNRIQKSVAALMALTITVLGAAGATAPLAFANVQAAAVHQAQSIPGSQHNIPMTSPSLRRV